MKFIKKLLKLIRRILHGDVMREINHMKAEIQYMKSVFAKREHLFDMAADIIPVPMNFQYGVDWRNVLFDSAASEQKRMK